MAYDSNRGAKKAWTKPEIRTLHLSDEQMAVIFPQCVTSPYQRQAAAK